MRTAGKMQQTDPGAGLNVTIPFPSSEKLRSGCFFPSALSHSKSCSYHLSGVSWCFLHLVKSSGSIFLPECQFSLTPREELVWW